MTIQRVRTVDFLPEIFQTSTNRQFLSATLDQLVQEPLTKGYKALLDVEQARV